MRSIDAHVHLSEREDDALLPFAKMNGLRYTFDGLMTQMKRHGVEQALLLSPPMKDGTPLPNQEIISLCRRSGGTLSPVFTVEPHKKAVASVLKLADETRKDLKGFKIRLGYVKASPDDSLFDPVFDFAESEGLPVFFHTGDTATNTGDLSLSHPLNLDRLANHREELSIVLCHFGNPWIEDAAEVVYKHPKVYADMSGLTTGGGTYGKKLLDQLARKISEAIYYIGEADKVFFGTDYPVTRHSDAFEIVKLLEIEEADKEKILWRNAKAVFNL